MRLINIVFSWSIHDVLNDDLYKKQVRKIPKTFSSSEEYLDSFRTPLLEETRKDLCSTFETVSKCSCFEIKSVEEHPGCQSLSKEEVFYKIELIEDGCVEGKKRSSETEEEDEEEEEEYGLRDLFAITDVKPRSFNDLDRPGMGYVIALVHGVAEDEPSLTILASKPLDIENCSEKRLYAVKLMNMTTNIRIWKAINANPDGVNMNIIRNVLQAPFSDTECCTLCQREEEEEEEEEEEKQGASLSDMRRRVLFFSDLNDSQKTSVLSCFDTKYCGHENTVKLIWGPPGTGKTKTVAFLLHSLLKMKCRTLTCAPTNVAVLEVARRLVTGVAGESPCSRRGYGLGDIVLFGNNKRMKIESHEELLDVFLDHRAKVLDHCYHWRYGWNCNLVSMISLLDDPEKLYNSYLKEFEAIKNSDEFKADGGNKLSNQVASLTLKDTKKKQKQKQKQKQKRNEEKEITDVCMSFEEFVIKRFDLFAGRLYYCIDNLYKHLPPSLISLEQTENMFLAHDSLKSFKALLRNIPSMDLKKALEKGQITRGNRFKDFSEARTKSLVVLNSLPSVFPTPYSVDSDGTEDKKELTKIFCLKNAVLIFCTASGSARMQKTGPCELLVIDEAAQLKECESAIPLQLMGIRHAILIGDEKQLPAMVKSKISEGADFGRSLYERLAILGHKKLLLNVQHRMHPSISLFPSREFYDNMISDGQNVKQETYSVSFLPGEMYGSYSFINVPFGEEEFDHKRSRRNLVEVAVVSAIVSALYKEILRTKKKARVGVISPYKAQVHALTERFEKRYTSDAQSDFSVRVRSVDGFQGGEDDIIIISTVGSNTIGSVGFLSNRNRANVALTRARHCLWIVGNGTTLYKSLSVWNKLIIDAMERSCFHNAADDQNLRQAMASALLDLNQIDVLASTDSLLFRSSKWKVSMTNDFWISMGRVKDDDLRNRAFSLLERLSSGWRRTETEQKNVFVHDGSSSLFVQYYEVHKRFYIAWAVDIHRESSSCTQFLKIWDILPLHDMPKLASKLDLFYGTLTVNDMNRCNKKLTEGNIIVPMRWPVQSQDRNIKVETSSTNIRFGNRPIYPNPRDQSW